MLVVDSLGETATTTISHARHAGNGVQLRRMLTISDPASLGYVYGAVTRHLGWRRGDEEGTVMALAALGDPARFRELFHRAIPITQTGFGLDLEMFPLRVLSSRWPRVMAAFIAGACPPRPGDAPVEQIHADVAAALKERTEQVMVHLACRARALTGASILLVAGGVAMNCVAIGQICQQAGFDRVAVPPAPGDAGTSAGAALAVYHELTGRVADGAAGVCYLGPDYPNVRLTSRPRPGLTAAQLTSPARLIAHRLADGQIIGLFQGRLEAGPRALGNRSILASPLQAGVVDRLNAAVKYREPFRPFAPVVLADHTERYFTLGQPSPFMSIASGVTDLAHRVIPAVVHVNGTARVQTVTPEQNPLLAEILTVFAAITGHPVLINTSLNIKGKPICGTPEAALDCLAEADLDALLLEDWVGDQDRRPRPRGRRNRPGGGGEMKIGYSFWGFLGQGITDTPDGGRSHRRTLIDGIISLGHQIVFLQPNRDLTDAGEVLRGTYTWDLGLPDIDVLFLEWRWPVPGRNTTACGAPGHTCDLHRQAELLGHYTRDRHTPTLLWDKDLQLAAEHPLRHAPHVTVCEAALHPGPGAARLLFPVADTALDRADPATLAALPRDLPLVYVGNQYDRDEPFERYFAPVAVTVPHLVAGKWTDTRRWPRIQFIGRVPFAEVQRLHRRALATMLLTPDRLAIRGQFTQRIFEAVLAGCVPLAPADLRAVDQVVPPELIARDAEAARAVLHSLTATAGSPEHTELISQCLHHLAPFRLSRQLTVLDRLLNQAIFCHEVTR